MKSSDKINCPSDLDLYIIYLLWKKMKQSNFCSKRLYGISMIVLLILIKVALKGNIIFINAKKNTEIDVFML